MSRFEMERALAGAGSSKRAGLVGGQGAAALWIALLVALSWLPTPALAQDVDPPVVEVLHAGAPLTDGELFATAVTPAVTVTDASPVTVTLTLDGQSFVSGTEVAAEGAHSLAVNAVDDAGNETVVNLTFSIDISAPAVSIGQPAAASLHAEAAVDVVGTVHDPHLLEVRVNGLAAQVTGSTFAVSGVPLAEGETVLTAVATDAAGNSSQASRSVVLDATAPAVAITDPAPGTVVPEAQRWISGTLADAHPGSVTVNGVVATLSGDSWSALVPLADGVNEITATAVDALGWSATAAVTVIRDAQAPEITLETPLEGSFWPTETVSVTGTVASEPGIVVTVNGVAAALDGTAFSATVPLVEGENRLIARAVDAVGNQGAHTRLVHRDTQAPELVTVDPAEGALALPGDAVLEFTFSEPLAVTAADAWSLSTVQGQDLAAEGTLEGAVLIVRPSSPLPSGTEVQWTPAAGLTDRAGNGLADPRTLTFTTGDEAAPAAPSLTGAPPAALCAPQIQLQGSAEAGARVEVAGGAAEAAVTAGTDGSFSVAVSLLPEQSNPLELTAMDAAGNRSAVLAVPMVHDCTAPRVVGASRAGDEVQILFSEVVEGAGLSSAVSVSSAAGAVAGTVTPSHASGGGYGGALFIADASLPAEPVRLAVAATVLDLAGNVLAYPYSAILGGEVSSSFVSGRILDAATGRPLAGATALVSTTDGVPHPAPAPEQTTAEDGRFSLPVPAGSHDLLLLRAGYTPAFRRATSAASEGAEIFDARLQPAAEAVVLDAAGGAWSDAQGSLRLDLPAGALAQAAPVAVTGLEEQALPALLPYGWSPRGGAWVDLGGEPLSADATLELPVEGGDGATLTVVFLDLGTLQWRVEGSATVAGGSVTVAVGEEGAWAAVEADGGSTAPPAPVLGTALPAAAAPDGTALTGAQLDFAPAVVLPAQTSLATVTYSWTEEVPSGTPLTLEVREELTLLDGTVRRPAPFEADLVLFRDSAGSARSRWRLQPSATARSLPLEIGVESVEVRRYAGELVAGDVLGPAGGTASTAQGDRVDVPAGALAEPAAVTLERRGGAELPLALPDGTLFLGALELDLGGAELTIPASLSLELGQAPAPGDEALLLELIRLPSGDVYRPVTLLDATAGGWTTAAADPADPSPLPWPAVRRAGLYLFVQLDGAPLAPLAFFHGLVLDAAGLPLEGAVVSAETAPWVQISAADGSYVLPAGLGATALLALDLRTLDQGTAAAHPATAGERLAVDLQVAVTGPAVLETVPAAGAEDVSPGIEPTVRFSEAVAPASLAAGLQLLQDGVPVPAVVELQGTLARLIPDTTLIPGAGYEVRINTAVRDLQGHRLAQAVTVPFTVLEIETNAQLDLRRVHLLEPDGAGLARVLGRSGAVPATALVFVENTSRLAATPSVTAAADGSFTLDIEADLQDTLLLHVLPDGVNETVVLLTPFQTRDGRGAFVGTGEARFTTFEDLDVEIEAGTFSEPTVVTAAVLAADASPAPAPADFESLAAFSLDLGGATALQPLFITLPEPAGATADELLLTRTVRIQDRPHWMLQDLLVRDGGTFTNRLAAGQAALQQAGLWQRRAQERWAASSLAASGSAAMLSLQSLGAAQNLFQPATAEDRWRYLPGLWRSGLYTVRQSASLLDFVALPFPGGGLEAFFLNLQIEGLAAVVDGDLYRQLSAGAVLLLGRRGEGLSLEGRELATGYRFYQDTLTAPAPGEVVEFPPSILPAPPSATPVGGSPLAFHAVDLERLAPVDGEAVVLAPGLELTIAGATVTFTAGEGAAAPFAVVRLVQLDGGQSLTAQASETGAFSLSATGGEQFVLAVGGSLAPREHLLLRFNRTVAEADAGLEVRDDQGRRIAAEVEALGDGRSLRLRPAAGWPVGDYTLHLLPELGARAGEAGWGESLTLPFQVLGSLVLPGLPEVSQVSEIARLGSLLFVAAEDQGLVVVDASAPGALVNYVAAGAAFAFPYGDAVRAVAVDPHGRVFAAGGGVASPGQLKILDPLRLVPGDPSSFAAAFRGSTLVSDRLGGDGLTYPPGVPQQLAVLSDDDRYTWRAGEATPAELSVTSSPAVPGPGLDITVAADPDALRAGLPVTLRNLTTGTWERVDAAADGSFAVTLQALAGDRLELLRNRRSLAYLGILGAGVAVADVNTFYGETDSPLDGDGLPANADVLSWYDGVGDPDLRLCGQPVEGLGSALVDLGTLADAGDPHPLVAAGLVGFRGLAMLESDVTNPGQISFFNELCVEIEGSRRVVGLEVVENYPVAVDRDGDGSEESVEERDFLLITHLTGGLMIFDATHRDDLRTVARIPLAGEPAAASVDRLRRQILVSTTGGTLHVVDFHRPGGVGLQDADGDGRDDRIVETVFLGGGTDAAALLVPELGLAFAGGESQELTGVALDGPELQAVRADDPAVVVPRLAPLGVPTALEASQAETSQEGARELPASFRVRARLPGSLGPQTTVEVLALGPGGLEMAGAGDPALLAGLPPTALSGADALVLRRLADDPWEDGYNLYLSDEVVALADLRAAQSFSRTAAEASACRRCDATAAGVGGSAREVLSGDRLAVRWSPALRSALEVVYGSQRLDAAQIEVASVRWEMAPSLRQEPSRNPSLIAGGDDVGLLLHSGEMTRTAVDLSVAGRGLDFSFVRTYRNQTLGAGPLGPGWEHSYHRRLRELPDGGVELYDGRGRRETFEPETRSDGTAGYRSPPGWFVTLEALGSGAGSGAGSGWLLHHADGTQETFDVYGRLVRLADAVKESSDTGNEMLFTYDLAGRLARVRDSLDRTLRFTYDAAGRLAELEDFTGRRVSYDYDLEGRLETVTLPAVTVGDALFPSGRTVSYSYEQSTGDLASRLTVRDNLTSDTDPRAETWLEVDFEDADGDGRSDEVTEYRLAGDPVQIAYDFGARTAAVTDRRQHVSTWTHSASGQAVSYLDAASRTWSWEYDGEGLPVRSTTPLGRVTEWTYQTACGGGAPDTSRRGRGDLTQIRQLPEPGNTAGANGSSSELLTCIDYETATHQPVRLTDPRGTVTEWQRHRGLVTSLRQAVGSAVERVTSVVYNDHGQPLEIVNPRGNLTRLGYHPSGPEAGYLAEVVADPDGLALITRYETDALGRVTAVVGPRGARHTRVWNEADWLVASTRAASGTQEGAASQPALGYTTRWLHDAAGQVLEIHRPYGLDGESATRESFAYGSLGEVLSRRREVEPGGPEVEETFAYDAALNLVAHLAEEGQRTVYHYDSRNLLERVQRGEGTAEQVEESFSYDEDRRRIAVTDARAEVWAQAYDGYGRPATAQDPLGNSATWSYDDGGLVTRQRRWAPGTPAEPLTESAWVYDALGRPEIEQASLWTPSEGYSGRQVVETRYGYDAADHLVSTLDSLGRETSWSYDAAERLTSTTDAAGNVVELTLDAAGNPRTVTRRETVPDGAPKVVTDHFVYDAAGRRIEGRDGLDNRTRSTYDARDQVRLVMDAEGYSTSLTYDGLDRLTRVERPEGILEILEYDAAGRRTGYVDALDQRTTYAYDALDRVTSVTYPDLTQRQMTYEGADLLATLTDANGTVVTQSHDAAGRLTTRTVALGTGVLGPTTETYTYDALNRLVQTTSGPTPNGTVTTTLTYDSLGRLLSETGPAGTVGYQRDAVGNAVELSYPSGLTLGRTPDPLNRLQVVGPKSGGTVTPQATYGYRGVDLVAQKNLANGLDGSFSYDGARRLIESSFLTTSSDLLLGERHSWSPRGLRTATTRDDLGGAGFEMRYDPAGRLAQVLQRADAVATVSNNTAELLPATVGEEFSFDFGYDPAQNLTLRQRTQSAATVTELPPDSSGRNRPASANGKVLEWDANGNLVRKGDFRFAYDFRNRLTEVRDLASTTLATYSYDTFNRRVGKTFPGGPSETTAWSVWQSVEEQRNGQLYQRRIFGRNLDEIVALETDLDGDGSLESFYQPLYDQTGNLVVLSGSGGERVGDAYYSPYGSEQWLRADLTPTSVVQVGVENGALWVEFSEEVSAERLEEGLAAGEIRLTVPEAPGGGALTSGGIGNLTAGSTISLTTAERPVTQGRLARRRLVLSPDTEPAAGTPVDLHLASQAIADLFLNEPASDFALSFSWPDASAGTPAVFHDTAPPKVEEVVVHEGHLEIQFSERPDVATTGAIQVDGQPLTWNLEPDGYTLRATSPLPAGSSSLTISPSLQDLAGT
ncbi:MAG: Ig-like domain-containing protein [Acidobacteriota bacterium]|nr:Ig-like domain-containing protein [Acidobacteriota bacterium]